MLPAKYRLKDKKAFNSVFRSGKTISGEVLLIKIKADSKGEIRIGFSVGLKFSKKSFQRNKVRRWIRESVRKNIERIKPGNQIIFLINSKYSYKQLSYQLVYQETKNILKKAKTSLYPKRDHLMRQLQRLGLKAEPLNTQQLIELFYNIYNPDTADTQKFATSQEYETPMVGANVEESVKSESRK